MNENAMSILKDCTIKDGTLYITSNISTERVKKLSNTLYDMFVDYEIPHYRVVSCCITDNGRVPESILSKIDGINMTYVELMDALSNIVLVEKHGEFYAPDIEGVDSIAQVMETEYAHVMIGEHEGIVTTSNGGLRFFGEPGVKVQCLVNNLDICNCVGINVRIYMYLAKGTGIVDYAKNGKRFSMCRNIVPCRTSYDLSKYVYVKPYVQGDTNVHFTYLKDVDEKVLSQMLSNEVYIAI